MPIPYPPVVEQAMLITYASLNERQRRLFAAAEAIKLGHGGIAYVARLFDCHRETTAFLQTMKAQARGVAAPSQLRPGPIQIDRFTLDVALDKDAARVEYAVLTQAEGGATIAARLPLAIAADLRPDVERVIQSMSITRKIEAK